MTHNCHPSPTENIHSHSGGYIYRTCNFAAVTPVQGSSVLKLSSYTGVENHEGSRHNTSYLYTGITGYFSTMCCVRPFTGEIRSPIVPTNKVDSVQLVWQNS
uniref:Uncharacterized protein n=1 Tax=Anguilla anguilla TaxID=7936 RepID=A0A0E9WWB7_ANGAN